MDWAPILEQWRQSVDAGIFWECQSNDGIDDRLPNGVLVFVRGARGQLRVMNNTTALQADTPSVPVIGDPDGPDVQVVFLSEDAGALEALEGRVASVYATGVHTGSVREHLDRVADRLDVLRERAVTLAMA